MQEELVNSNAKDDIFVANTTVEQIKTGLSSAASKEEKFQLSLSLYLVY
jgi:hypothetical protein